MRNTFVVLNKIIVDRADFDAVRIIDQRIRGWHNMRRRLYRRHRMQRYRTRCQRLRRSKRRSRRMYADVESRGYAATFIRLSIFLSKKWNGTFYIYE